jgi:DNA repair protein RecO (recombination protein O)
MLHTTRGIVFHFIKYSESSAIVKIYTEQFGLKSYMFRGVFKSRARVKANMLQQLNLVELVADNRDYKGLQNPKELRIEYLYKTLPYDIKKSTVSLFITEILYRAIKYEEPDTALFNFIRNSLIWFDETNKDAINFHLWFCLQLTRYLGFFPAQEKNGQTIFNLEEGVFQSDIPIQQLIIEPPLSKYFQELLKCRIEDLPNLIIPHKSRTGLIEHIIDYYKLHIHDMGEIRSHKVLAEVLS